MLYFIDFYHFGTAPGVRQFLGILFVLLGMRSYVVSCVRYPMAMFMSIIVTTSDPALDFEGSLMLHLGNVYRISARIGEKKNICQSSFTFPCFSMFTLAEKDAWQTYSTKSLLKLAHKKAAVEST